MENKNWQKLKELGLLILGTYGERLFTFLHTMLKNMPPNLFCASCFLIAAIFIVCFPED